MAREPYALIYHDGLHVRGGAERVFSYFLRFFEEVADLPYLVLTLTEINAFPYVRRLAKEKPHNFLTLHEAFKKHKILYVRLVRLLQTLYGVRKTRGKPRLLLVTKGVSMPHFTNLVGYVFRDADVKLLRLPDLYELNVLTGYSPQLHEKRKISLAPARALNRLLAKSYNFGDAHFLANSPEMKEAILKAFSSLKNRVDVLYPPFDDEFFYPRSGLREDYSVAVIGRIHPSKNTHRALDIFREVKEGVRGAKLYIVGDVGDDRYHGWLIKEVAERDLSDSVTIVTDGRPEVLREYMWRSKVCWCLTSGYFGITNVESLACGAIPIVLPGSRSSVGRFGYVASNNREFAKLTVEILMRQTDWKRIIDGYRWVKGAFSQRAFFNRLHEIFKELGIL